MDKNIRHQEAEHSPGLMLLIFLSSLLVMSTGQIAELLIKENPSLSVALLILLTVFIIISMVFIVVVINHHHSKAKEK